MADSNKDEVTDKTTGEEKENPQPKADGINDTEATMQEAETGGSSYRDFSKVLPDKQNDASSLIAQSTTAKEPTFPVKLHMILSNPEFQDIIAWLPHGRSWRILQQKAFEERVIPLYFRHGRYSSFARQVNGWGFKRITHGSDYNSYYHELFLRGMPHLCDKMRRLTTKDLNKKKKMDDGPTPDFYALSRENPLPESTPVPTSTLTPPAMAAVGRNEFANADMELALLERRRADIFNRMNLLASTNGIPAAQLGQQDAAQQQMNIGNNSLVAAAALSLGNNGRPNTLNTSSMQQPVLAGGMGQMLDPSNAVLQRQLLEARFGNADMASILGLNANMNMGMQNAGMLGLNGGANMNMGLQNAGMHGAMANIQGSVNGGVNGLMGMPPSSL